MLCFGHNLMMAATLHRRPCHLLWALSQSSTFALQVKVARGKCVFPTVCSSAIERIGAKISARLEHPVQFRFPLFTDFLQAYYCSIVTVAAALFQYLTRCEVHINDLSAKIYLRMALPVAVDTQGPSIYARSLQTSRASSGHLTIRSTLQRAA